MSITAAVFALGCLILAVALWEKNLELRAVKAERNAYLDRYLRLRDRRPAEFDYRKPVRFTRE